MNNNISLAEFVAYAERAMEGRYSTRSTADRAIIAYMEELLDTLRDAVQFTPNKQVSFAQEVEKLCLNGAGSWQHYSLSGCSLCYNDQIAERNLPPSRRNSYSSERLLRMQGSRLMTASWRLKRLFVECKSNINA